MEVKRFGSLVANYGQGHRLEMDESPFGMYVYHSDYEILRKACEAACKDDAFAELCAAIGEEPSWLKAMRAAIA